MSATQLAARQLAALRRHQWSTLDAAGFVAQALPTGVLKGACERAVQGLRAGNAAPAAGSTALERLLARGEQASPESFECLAESLEARAQSEAGAASAVGMARVLVVGPLLLGCVFGWVLVPQFAAVYGRTLPVLTQLSIWVLSLLALGGVPFSAAAWFLLPRVVRRWAPGARELVLAAELFDASATGAAGPPARALAGANLKLYLWRLGKVGQPVAAREAAEQLLAEGREKIARFDRLAPMVVLAFGAGVFGALFAPLFFPLFTLAGQLK